MMKLKQLFLFLIFIPTISFTQEKSLGFFNGMNFSSIQFVHNLKIEGQSNYLRGFVIGFNYTQSINKILSIRGELVGDVKGGEFCTGFITSTGNRFGPTNFTTAVFSTLNNYCVEDGFTYIGVPLLLQINIGKKIKYLFQAGHSISYLFHRHNSYGEDEIKKMSHSALVGMGFSVPIIDKISIQANARFAHGLNDFSKKNTIDLRHLNYSGIIGLQYQLN